MTAVNAPFGLRAVRRGMGGSATGQEVYTIASSYGTAIFNSDPIILNTDGTIIVGVAATPLFGVMYGCEYTTSDGYYRVRPNWIASTALLAGTTCLTYVTRDPFTEYFIQCGAPVPLADTGDESDVVMGAGVALSGLSTSSLNSTRAGTGSVKQLRIVGLADLPNNAWGDAFTIVRVVINQLSGYWPAPSGSAI